MNNTIKLLVVLLSFALCATTMAATELPELNQVPGSDWLNVRNFGVKGDGITDDTATMQKAFDQIEDGSVIYLPAGTYIIKNELRLRKNKVTGKEKRLLGTAIIGHGRNTVLRWEGPENGTMLREIGMVHCRITGMVFEGNNRAAVGYTHDNGNMFETHIVHQFMAFRNFRQYGILSEDNKKDGLSTAEIAFVNTIFENCRTGISFVSFNDYDYTFDGCLFKDNTNIGVECINGNFYIRNSRFENNAIDVKAVPEHGSSIRRSVSVNSGVFLDYANAISPITVERCLIVDWKGPAAIVSKGAPLTCFDNSFKHRNATAVPLQADPAQPILLAANRLNGPANLSNRDLKATVTVDLPPCPEYLNESTSFIPESVILPGKLFDAKRDFGAKGDGKTDDTTAIQQTIDAARAFGNNAIAYLPRGYYRTVKPLELDGSGYYFGGSGLYSQIVFAGMPDENAIKVRPDGELTVENMSIKRMDARNDGRKFIWSNGKGADIRQYPSAKGSRVTYDSVYVNGKYVHAPFLLGFRLEDLAAHDTVVLNNVEGNIHAINSGAATLFAPVSYEGTVWVKGAATGGVFGILTRLTTLSEYSIYLEDNQSLIASDFYIEQAAPKTITLRGNSDARPGRVTISNPKLDINREDSQHVGELIDIDNYHGEVNFIATQLYPPKSPAKLSISGNQTRLGIFSSFFYVKSFELNPVAYPVEMLTTSGNSEFNTAQTQLSGAQHHPEAARNALLDLRRVGELDWQLNYPALLKK